jgi:hypothetical protein
VRARDPARAKQEKQALPICRSKQRERGSAKPIARFFYPRVSGTAPCNRCKSLLPWSLLVEHARLIPGDPGAIQGGGRRTHFPLARSSDLR